MTDTLRHRGPDASGYHFEAGIGLGHRRLRIIDLETGDQPMTNEDDSLIVIYNGEIYNFGELRSHLIQRGHVLKTDSDTEVLLHLYEENPETFVTQLRGMFAFALYDRRRRRLTLGRDRLGQKPLYYYEDGEVFAFASEMKALLRLPRVNREIDLQALDEYLANLFVLPPATLYRHIRQVPPGHLLLREGSGHVALIPYWRLPLPRPTHSPLGAMEPKEEEEGLLKLLRESVELRLVSDVPLGAFLSGGIDSSLIVALMSQAAPERVKTFSIGFADATFDESAHARNVSQFLGTEHYEETVGYDPSDLVPEILRQFDQPFGDSSAIPTYLLSRLTRQHVIVALSGDGCDELFAGYRRYQARSLLDRWRWLPRGLRRSLLRLLTSKQKEGVEYYGTNWQKKLLLLAEFAERMDRDGFASWYQPFSEEERGELIGPDLSGRLRDARMERVARLIEESRNIDRVAQMIWVDIQTYLPEDILTKVDRMTMAHGLEVRSPFLDHRLIERVAEWPIEFKLKGSETKHLLRRVAQSSIPCEVLRRPKQGFQVPLGAWFRNSLRDMFHDLLLSGSSSATSVVPLEREPLERLWQEHQQGRRDHGHRLYALLSLQVWATEQKGP